MLYGKEFMKDFKNQTSIPMALFCRNNKMEPSQGKDVPGMSFKLCNDFHPILTDVGLCMAKDSAYDLDIGKMKINQSIKKQETIPIRIVTFLKFYLEAIKKSNTNP